MARLRGLRFGLTQRTMLLLVVAVSGSLAVLAFGFSMQRRDDYAEFVDAHARNVAAQVHSTRLVLESVPAAYRRSISEGLKSSGVVYALPGSEATPPRESASAPVRGLGLLGMVLGPPTERLPDVSEAIARYTTPPSQVRFVRDPGPRYWVSQDIGGERWWIVVLAGDPPPGSDVVPWPAVAAVLLSLLAVAALYASSITRPLRELAEATHRIGDGWPDPVDIDGPHELRDLADSFNGMLVRLRQIEGERLVLLGGLPHDLRAPLTRLRLRLATLTDLGEHPGIADDIASIDRIVRQFSEYLRGVQPDEPRLPLDDLVHAAVEANRSLGRDVSIEGDGEVAVRMPQFAVRRLLDNLIENAVQHGSEPVRVSLQRVSAGVVELCVTDHGPGIAPEVAEMALQPFTKLDPARGRGGCGLGLAIVRQLARQLGGYVRLVKEPNYFSVIVGLGVE